MGKLIIYLLKPPVIMKRGGFIEFVLKEEILLSFPWLWVGYGMGFLNPDLTSAFFFSFYFLLFLTLSPPTEKHTFSLGINNPYWSFVDLRQLYILYSGDRINKLKPFFILNWSQGIKIFFKDWQYFLISFSVLYCEILEIKMADDDEGQRALMLKRNNCKPE